jgi:hypothetical protein
MSPKQTTPTVKPDRLAALDTISLAHGKHTKRADGMCLLEAASWIAGERFSDHPDCVDPVIAAFGRSWNDQLAQEDRDRLLKPILPKLIGTRSTPAVQDVRAFMAADWAVRVFTPAWLRLAGLVGNAADLEALPALDSVEACKAARPTIDAARTSAVAAWVAAGDAAWDAAWVAAGDAAGAAAGDAARAAAWAAAGDAAWAAAGDAARAAARDAAWDAAGAAAWAAAGDAARAAAGDAAWDAARAAARDAAWAALAPTVATLQTSALELLDRMINTEAAG